MRTRRSRKRFCLHLPVRPGLFLVTALVALLQRHRTQKSKSAVRPPEIVPLPVSPPRVSIIVPVRSEAAHIDSCLASLCAQDYPAFEILVVSAGPPRPVAGARR
jgi:chlorobactene glucosyltransferase